MVASLRCFGNNSELVVQVSPAFVYSQMSVTVAGILLSVLALLGLYMQRSLHRRYRILLLSLVICDLCFQLTMLIQTMEAHLERQAGCIYFSCSSAQTVLYFFFSVSISNTATLSAVAFLGTFCRKLFFTCSDKTLTFLVMTILWLFAISVTYKALGQGYDREFIVCNLYTVVGNNPGRTLMCVITFLSAAVCVFSFMAIHKWLAILHRTRSQRIVSRLSLANNLHSTYESSKPHNVPLHTYDSVSASPPRSVQNRTLPGRTLPQGDTVEKLQTFELSPSLVNVETPRSAVWRLSSWQLHAYLVAFISLLHSVFLLPMGVCFLYVIINVKDYDDDGHKVWATKKARVMEFLTGVIYTLNSTVYFWTIPRMRQKVSRFCAPYLPEISVIPSHCRLVSRCCVKVPSPHWWTAEAVTDVEDCPDERLFQLGNASQKLSTMIGNAFRSSSQSPDRRPASRGRYRLDKDSAKLPYFNRDPLTDFYKTDRDIKSDSGMKTARDLQKHMYKAWRDLQKESHSSRKDSHNKTVGDSKNDSQKNKVLFGDTPRSSKGCTVLFDAEGRKITKKRVSFGYIDKDGNIRQLSHKQTKMLQAGCKLAEQGHTRAEGISRRTDEKIKFAAAVSDDGHKSVKVRSKKMDKKHKSSVDVSRKSEEGRMFPARMGERRRPSEISGTSDEERILPGKFADRCLLSGKLDPDARTKSSPLISRRQKEGRATYGKLDEGTYGKLDERHKSCIEISQKLDERPRTFAERRKSSSTSFVKYDEKCRSSSASRITLDLINKPMAVRSRNIRMPDGRVRQVSYVLMDPKRQPYRSSVSGVKNPYRASRISVAWTRPQTLEPGVELGHFSLVQRGSELVFVPMSTVQPEITSNAYRLKEDVVSVTAPAKPALYPSLESSLSAKTDLYSSLVPLKTKPPLQSNFSKTVSSTLEVQDPGMAHSQTEPAEMREQIHLKSPPHAPRQNTHLETSSTSHLNKQACESSVSRKPASQLEVVREAVTDSEKVLSETVSVSKTVFSEAVSDSKNCL